MQPPRAPWWKNTRGEWFVVVQTILFALIVLGPASLDLRPALPGGLRLALAGIGLVLGAVGALLAFAGLLGLGRNLSVLPHPKDDAELVQGNAYALVRHPIYSGLITGALGWALLTNSLITLVYAVILFIFFDLKSRREERWLIQKFPQYRAYQRRVRKLIPFVY